MMPRANKKAEASAHRVLQRLLAHFHERSFRSTSASRRGTAPTVPAGLKSRAPSTAIVDEGVVVVLLWWLVAPDSPGSLGVAACIQLEKVATAFILFQRSANSMRYEVDQRRGLNKEPALATAMKFLFVPCGGPWPLESIRGQRQAHGRQPKPPTRKTFTPTMHPSNAFYGAPPRSGHGLYLRPDSKDLQECTRSPLCSRDKLDMICCKLSLRPG